jgi:hypothetical protein
MAPVPVLRVVAPVWEILPPKLEVPLPTVKVEAPATEVLPVIVVVPFRAIVAPLKEVVSLESPMVMLSASALVPIVMVSQAAVLQADRLVALMLARPRAPAVERSRSLPKTLPEVVMLSAPTLMAPKLAVMLPASRVPVPVIAVLTASLVSTRAASLPSRRLSSVASRVTPFRTMVELPLPVKVRVSLLSPIWMVSASALVPIVMVSQAAELHRLREVAVVLPIPREVAVAVSRLGVRKEPSARPLPEIQKLEEACWAAIWFWM